MQYSEKAAMALYSRTKQIYVQIEIQENVRKALT